MMTNKEFTFRRILYMLLAITIAIGVWYYVDEYGDNGQARTVSVEITDIPIEYLNADTVLADRGLMLLDDEATDKTVDLVLETTRRRAGYLDRSKIRVTADLSDVLYQGRQSVTYKVSYRDSHLSTDTVKVVDSSIYTANINVCELNRKVVDVRCELSGNVADGYSAGSIQFSPQTIELRGQMEDIMRIDHVKVMLDIGTDLKESIRKELPYQFCNASGKAIEVDQVRTEVDVIQVSMPVSVTKELDLVIDFQQAPGARLKNMAWKLQPSSIVVSGDASILNRVNSIVLDTFDLMTVNSETTTHTYSIIVPEGCENLSGVTRATLEIAYPEWNLTQVDVTKFRYENAPPDKDLDILTEQITATIFGTAEDVAATTGDHLVVVADLSGYAMASGTYTVPAWVESEGSEDIGIVGTYTVQVRVGDPAAEE